jgi:hypothetical protein
MIKDQLRELRARLDQLEQIALATPAENWPETFDALLERWELGAATAREGCISGGVAHPAPSKQEPG